MSTHQFEESVSQRLYSVEGGVHLYSSLPTVITPADLYQLEGNPNLKTAILNANIYVVAQRTRIFVDPASVALEGRVLLGRFLIQRADRWEAIAFRFTITPDRIGGPELPEDVAVAESGTHVLIVTPHRKTLVPVNVVIAEAESGLTEQDRDLLVVYVGQAIGRDGKRTAIDRLRSHSTFQRILAMNTTFCPFDETLLLLFRFEHGRMVMSNGGDFNAEPQASSSEDRWHMDNLSKVKLGRHAIVSLAEAALIRHFKPFFNVQLKSSDFSGRRKAKVLSQLLSQGVAGLIVELCTANIRSRLWTEHARPFDMNALLPPQVLDGDYLSSDADKVEWREQLSMMAHTHIASFPLTTVAERDTFLHGILWSDSEARMPLWPS